MLLRGSFRPAGVVIRNSFETLHSGFRFRGALGGVCHENDWIRDGLWDAAVEICE